MRDLTRHRAVRAEIERQVSFHLAGMRAALAGAKFDKVLSDMLRPVGRILSEIFNERFHFFGWQFGR
jgi:hypothetical protein